jgi:hypothetical protein
MYRGHHFGRVIRILREKRLAGASVADLLQFLKAVFPEYPGGRVNYLGEAFCRGSMLRVVFGIQIDEPDADALERTEEWIDQSRPEWSAQPIADLFSLRDYFAFLEFSRDERLNLFVGGVGKDDQHYRLHGAYDSDSDAPVWSATRGERLRAALNRRLGKELVLRGPHDEWVHRNNPEKAGLLCGPQVPVIQFFGPEGIFKNLVTVRALKSAYGAYWSRLYPDHPVKP